MGSLEYCPYCGSGKGYYLKTRIYGNALSRFNFNKEYDEENNSDIHDGLTYKFSKWAYCQACDKRLFNNEEAERDGDRY